MDIRFEKDDYKFNVRSSCIIKDKNQERVLLTYMRAVTDSEAFLLPGGRLELLENSYEAIKRELNEELGINISYQLIAIEENIVKENKFHMLEYVFYGEVDSFEELKSLDNGWDKFKIVDIKNIDNYDIRPETIKKLISQESYEGVKHHINYNWLNLK